MWPSLVFAEHDSIQYSHFDGAFSELFAFRYHRAMDKFETVFLAVFLVVGLTIFLALVFSGVMFGRIL